MLNNNTEYITGAKKIKIENLAEYIADYYSPKGPINLETIADSQNITYSYGKYEDCFDGLLEHSSGSFHIYINEDRLGHGYTDRARFTFAHELGHYFIDEHRNALAAGLAPSHPSIFTGFANENLVEREADYFASCLLLPQKRFIRECRGRKFNFAIIQELAKKYQVSLTATVLRFSAIGNHPIMVIYSVNNQIKWYWHSKDFPFTSLKHGKKAVPTNTVAYEYFSQQKKRNQTEEIYSNSWFNIYDDAYNRKLYEHCIYGSNNNVLSVIWEN